MSIKEINALLVDLMTYDDFVAIELLNLQDENTILNIDKENNAIMIEYCPSFSYKCSKKIMLIAKNDEDFDVNIPANTNCSMANFDDVERRLSNIQSLFVRKPYDIPPNLCKLKKILLKEIMDTGYQSNDSIENIEKIFESAQKICDEYEYCHTMYNSDLALHSLIHNETSIYVIDGIDEYRGYWEKQKMLVDVIKFRVEHGKKCILKLWDLDSGFEYLSSGLKELIEDGRVEIYFSNYMKLGLQYADYN